MKELLKLIVQTSANTEIFSKKVPHNYLGDPSSVGLPIVSAIWYLKCLH